MAEIVKRKVFEEGHTRKFMVVVDDTPECEVALYFAARVASRTGGSLVLFYVIEPGDFQHWLGVREIQNEEERNRAQAVFRLFRMKLKNMGFEDLKTEAVVREGNKAEEIVRYIEQDEDVAVLVLGAAADPKAGPGPLVSSLAAGSYAGTFPIPIYIVPGTLTTDQIAALA